jgi:CRP-like cAMP-binding protein
LCRNDELTRQGDVIDYFGIIVHGEANVMFEHNAAKNLSIGDTIGQCFAADFTEKDNNKHPYTISAKTSGMIAILPLSDIKSESRKNPEAVRNNFISYFLRSSSSPKSLQIRRMKQYFIMCMEWNTTP